MNESRNRVRSIFLEAIENHPPGRRAAFLDEACGDDLELRGRVEALLEADGRADSLLDGPAPMAPGTGAGMVAAPGPAAEGPGTVVGPYRLLEVIGEGGMGVVYRAEQARPVRRTVALKVIKPGMDSAQVLARFEAERQALALMDHPNIARVFDAGATESGRPYFIMELVEGVPITRFCDERRLTPRERMELFIPVCRAVQHAHQKGIIHRDLKPSNVLVALYDGRPVPKVIDFGIAKATGETLTEATLYTSFGMVVGTLEYMSPEQAGLDRLDVDTRSDIYSLGVLLYELLTGTTPLNRERLRRVALLEVLRLVREEEPPRPSTRLSTTEALPEIAANRGLEPRKLPGLVRDELDWIVMKALEKDRARRYATANDLAADLRRHLDDEPIEARGVSAVGRMRRFARRNRVAVVVASLALAAAGIAASFALFAQRSRLRELELELAIGAARVREQDQRWAREFAVPQIERHRDADRVVAAFALAREAARHLPKDPTLRDIWSQLSATATLTSGPPGVRVAIRDWDGDSEDWLVLGRTPLRDEPLPGGVLRWRFDKDGYVPREMVADLRDAAREPIRLTTTAETPEAMASIPPGVVELVPGEPLEVGAFWIDRFEVTNRRFQEFVEAGGYEDRRYWTEEFSKDGAVLPRDEAMKAFRDRTGRPGPATWADGRYPCGMGEHPVQGVSWYEAAAFAAFSGKRLPTVAHWMRAACIDQEPYIIPLSNSLGPGPAPVGSHTGTGRFDVRDTAGNVREWCWNADGATRRRTTMGGAWDEPGHMFRFPIATPPFSRSPQLGFRCMKGPGDLPTELLASTSHIPRRYELETRATLQQLEAYKLQYLYDRDAPLNARPVASMDEGEACRHEVVRIDAAYGRERFDVHIFLPRKARPPYRTLVHFPGAGAVNFTRLERRPGSRSALDYIDGILGFVERGWAVCWPIYWGTYERRSDVAWLSPSIVARDRYVQIAKDLSRSVDYLRSRGDMDPDRLAYFGFSWGAMLGPVMTAAEPRFRAAVLLCGGYRYAPQMPEVESFQFAPSMRIPTLMINGRHDPVFYHEWYQRPLYRDLGSKEKVLVVLDAGHSPPAEDAVELAHRWLMDTFRGDGGGPVRGGPGPELLARLGTMENLVGVFTGPEEKLEARQIEMLMRRNEAPKSPPEAPMPNGLEAFSRN